MAAIQTVKVRNGSGGFALINESDFDPATDTVWQETPEPAPEPVSRRKQRMNEPPPASESTEA